MENENDVLFKAIDKRGNEITGPFIFGDKEADDDIKKCIQEEIDKMLIDKMKEVATKFKVKL